MSKKTVAVLFGGQSSEHEVSCVSATTIISNINKEKYNIRLIGITKDGRWLKVDSVEDIQSGAWRESTVTAMISPDASWQGVIYIDGDNYTKEKIDVVFPALHGLYGEDGTVQGLLETCPYTVCRLWSSGICSIHGQIIYEDYCRYPSCASGRLCSCSKRRVR